jgi:hypothetical protein
MTLRAGLVSDPPVGAPEHQDLEQLPADYPIGDAGAVVAEWMVCPSLGQEGFELLEDGLDDVWLDGGHETCSFDSGTLENSPDDGPSVPTLHVGTLPLSTEALNTKITPAQDRHERITVTSASRPHPRRKLINAGYSPQIVVQGY